MLPYEMKFLVPNYSCLQNPWLWGYCPSETRSLCPQLNLLNPARKKFLGTPLVWHDGLLTSGCVTFGMLTHTHYVKGLWISLPSLFSI